MRRNELGASPGWERAGELAGAPISEGLTMIRTSFRVALSALLFAGALGLASTGAAQAQSIMKQCGDEWKAAKANNTTNGLTWPQFLKQCRDREGGRRGSRCSSCRRSCPSAGSRSSRAGPGANLSAEAEARASRSPDRRWPIQLGGGSQRPLPRRHRGLGQHQGQVPHLSLLGLTLVRHDEAGRLHVRGRCWRRRLPCVEEQDGTAETAALNRVRSPRSVERSSSALAHAMRSEIGRYFSSRAIRGRQSGSCALSANWVKRRRLYE